MDPCIEWQGTVNGDGYGVRRLPAPSRVVYAHRLAWEDAYGPIPAGGVIHHRCGNRSCVNPAHLELMRSQADHASAHGRDLDVQAMRDLRAAGWSYGRIARLFGVTPQAISYHVRNELEQRRAKRAERLDALEPTGPPEAAPHDDDRGGAS